MLKAELGFVPNENSAELAVNLFFKKAFDYCLIDNFIVVPKKIKIEIINKEKTAFDLTDKLFVMYKDKKHIDDYEFILNDEYKEKLVSANKTFRYVN